MIHSSKTKTSTWRRHVSDELATLAAGGGGSTAAAMINATAVASTSGTSIDFAIPSGVKSLSVSFVGVSTSGSSDVIIQLGDAGGVETTGYLGGSSNDVGGTRVNNSTGFNIHPAGSTAVFHGTSYHTLADASTNSWTQLAIMANSHSVGKTHSGGSKDLSAELTTVRVTMANGTDTFDLGTINVQYENTEVSTGPTGATGPAGTGIVVQAVHTQDGEVATGTTTMPDSDAAPTSSQGNEFMTASITPTSAANKLRIDVTIVTSTNALEDTIIALYQDATVDCIASCGGRSDNVDVISTVTFTHWMTAGTVSSTTFKVRAGSTTSGTMTFNGHSSARKNGGTMASTITITEYAV